MAKKTTRILCMLLTVILVFTGMQFSPAAVTGASAESEQPGSASFGSTNVPEADEILTLGEWQYYVSGGTAIIAGYTDENVQTLNIPYNLAGYAVTGIAHNAFSRNTALRRVHMHTNITAIAGDAFAGLSGVTVSAYHGAYPLRYAAQTEGLTPYTVTDNAGFEEGVVDLTGLNPKAYQMLQKDSVTFVAKEATFLKEGLIVYFPRQGNFPTGLAAHIDHITRAGDVLLVDMSQPAFDQTFTSFTGAGDIYIDWDRATYYDGVTPMSDAEAESRGLIHGEYNLSPGTRKASKSMNLNLKLNDKLTISGSLTTSVSAEVNITIERWVAWFAMTKGTLKITTENTVTGALKYKNNLVETQMGGKEEWRRFMDGAGTLHKQKACDVPFVSAYGFTGYLSVEIVFELTGSLSLTYTTKKTELYTFKNGKLTKESLPGSKNCTISMEAKLKIGPKLTVYFEFGIAGIASVKFFEASIGVFFEATGKITYTFVKGITDGVICLDISYEVYIEISMKFGLIEVEFFIGKLPFDAAIGFTYKISLLKETRNHFDGYSVGSLAKGFLMSQFLRVNTCNLKDRKAKFIFGNGKADKEQTYTVNDFLQNPGTPTRSGYIFKGWVIDKSASGWGSGEEAVVFGSTQMPFLKPGSTLIVRAKWQKYDPPTGISLSKTSITGYSNCGTTEKINATVSPSYATNKAVKWSSSNASVASVSNDGTVKLLNPGQATITCTSVDKPSIKATCTVNVQQSVTGISLNMNNISRYSDNLGTVQLTQTVSPSNAANKNVTWTSSNPAVASVTSGGLVTLKSVGSATVTCASVSNPSIVGKCQVNVLQAVTGITLNRTSVDGYSYAKQTATVIPTIYPSNAANKAVTWTSSNPDVVKVSGDGIFSFQGVGTATVTCTSVSQPAIKATCQVTVRQSVTEIGLDRDSIGRWSDDPDKEVQLTATVGPENAADKSLTWTSSNTDVATVSSTGLVTLKNAGTAVIRCSSVSNPNVEATFAVTIWRAVDSLTMNKTTVERTKDLPGAEQLTVTVAPTDAYNKSVTWSSSNTDVATVSADGAVTIHNVGTAVVTATSVSTPGKTASCTFEISHSVTGMSLNQTAISRYSSQTGTVQLTETLEAVQEANRTVFWTSDNENVATVSGTGVVTIHGVGDATITCTSESNPDVKASCAVHIMQSVLAIDLDKTSLDAFTNCTEGVQLTPTIQPADAANKDLVWTSSDETVAAVSDTGYITVNGSGVTTITCRSVSDPDVTGTCAVTVRQGVTSVSLNQEGINAYSSDTDPILLTYKTLPTDAYDRTVTWQSSDPSVATVSETGVVTIQGAGTAEIYCTSHSNPNVSAKCTVNVRQAVDSITLNQTSIICQNAEAEAVQLTADVQPANAANRDVIWTSSDENVARVSDTGLVTITGTGAATITCRSVISPNVTATCEVGVNQAVYAVTLNEHEHICFSDETDPFVLTAIVQPGIAYDKSLTWTSSKKSVATVSNTGRVTIKGAGTATITCASVSAPDIKDTCVITVKRAISSVTLDQSSMELNTVNDADGRQLTATISPANAEESELVWTSSNQDVAMVTDSGLVIPTGAGTATITCASARTNTVKAECAVTVTEPVSSIVIEGDGTHFMPGETIQLTANCYPETASDKRVTWTSSNSGIASVNASGLVTAAGYGTAVIRAAATANADVYDEYEVTVERELELETKTVYDTIYPDEENSVGFAEISATPTSAIRMVKAGQSLTWSLKNPTDEVHIETCGTTVMDDGEAYETTYAALYADHFTGAGEKTYTVVCTAGNLTAEAEVSVNVASADYARNVGIVPPVITVQEGEQATVPNIPQSLDGNPVPEGIGIVNIEGDNSYRQHASEAETENGTAVTFDESGIYRATVNYRAANLMYEAPVTFEVTDAQGRIHYKAETLELSHDHVRMVEGASTDLTCEITPANTYNKAVTWSSTDETVATVDANGHVTAVGAGTAVILCTTTDGSEISDSCGITVESFLQLDESALDYTVYANGDSRADLGIVNVTPDSEERIAESGLNVTWSLQRISGEATEIAVSEFRGTSEQGIAISGNQIKLIRMNGTGTDVYRLTCKAGDYTASCMITVHVIAGQLPESISLRKSTFTGQVEAPIEVETTYSCLPEGTELPEGTSMTIEGGRAFVSALSTLYNYGEPETLYFEKGGIYQANVVFSGDNYRYVCPITVMVQNEDSSIPVNVTEVTVSESSLYMDVGESRQLTAGVVPADANHSAFTWASSDTSVATVNSQGRVTAIGDGTAFIFAGVDECDFVGGCFVVVESGLTLQSDSVERTVYLDGITRYPLETLQLTAASSQRLNGEKPEWSLSRVNNNNLTLRLEDYESSDESGNPIYGCRITLYSVSREGDAEYELRCTAGAETATIPVVVHAVNRERLLPASVDLTQKVYEGEVGELIKIEPQFICLPEGTALPDGIRTDIKGNAVFNNALNTEDYYTSQSLSTLSFNRAGLFEAEIYFTYSNMRYMVPVTFRIRDGEGNVPIPGSSVSLNRRNLFLLEGETESLTAVFTPVEADDQAVTWQSTNPAVATVNAQGQVTAVGKGEATIICEPHDSYLYTMYCPVTVEDALTVECGNSEVTLYKQGDQICELPGAWLTSGTIYRMKKHGVKPQWTLDRVSGAHTDLEMIVSDDADTATVRTKAILSGGQDVYRLTCATADEQWSREFTVNVIDAGNAPQKITPAQSHVTAAVGETVNIDFSPVCSPAGSVMPQSDNMWDIYIGIGQDFYDAVDQEVYETNGNQATVAFTKPGCYVLSRQFEVENLHYSETCEIIVGQAEEKYDFIKMNTEDVLLYLGGESGTVASAAFIDPVLEDVFENEISWILTRVSGKSTTAVLKQAENGADLFIANANRVGTDVWRITCVMGEYSCAADITVRVEQPRRPAPYSIHLTQSEIEGMMGDWLSMPIGIVCEPLHTALPETGDDFWTFGVIGREDVCDWTITDGRLKVRFLQPGYFTGELKYTAGNFHYTLPVFITVTDEEGVLNRPDLGMYLSDAADIIYAGGQTNIPIGTATVSEGLAEYYAGTAPAYLMNKTPVWNVSIVSGNAAELSVRSAGVNTADIILNRINGTGTVEYRVSCTVDGTTYQETHTMSIVSADTVMPDVTLGSSTYYTEIGEELAIPRTLYERSTGSILQGASSLVTDSIMEMIGYMFSETDDEWRATFYETGTYETTASVRIGNLIYQIPIRIVVRDKGTPEPAIPVIRTPAALQIIEEYAFENSNAQIVDLTDSRVTTIGTGAFRNCTDLKLAYIPASVTTIGDGAFYGCINLTIVCEPGSAAEQYAGRNGINIVNN